MPFNLSNWIAPCRQQRTRWLGQGPWRAWPWSRLLAARRSESGWHEPEAVDGEIVTIPHEAMAFRPGDPLLDQAPSAKRMESGELRFRLRQIAPALATRFWSIGSAGVLGEDGLVYCPRFRTAVAETARTINHAAGVHPALGFSRPVSGRLPGVSLLLAGPFGQAHYHFLWDLLGKLALWPAPLRRSVDHFLVGVPPSPGITDWLRAAQVPLERVTWLTGGSHLLCEQLIFSSLPCEVNQPRPEVVRALRTLFPSSGPAEASRWLWISRQGQSQRDLRWEDQILTALPRFERLDLGALPAREQIRAFAAAGVVAGPHGSGLANLAFVHGAGDLIEFFPEDSPEDPLFGRIAAVVGWRHAWARCNFAQPHAAGAVIAALRHRLAGK